MHSLVQRGGVIERDLLTPVINYIVIGGLASTLRPALTAPVQDPLRPPPYPPGFPEYTRTLLNVPLTPSKRLPRNPPKLVGYPPDTLLS